MITYSGINCTKMMFGEDVLISLFVWKLQLWIRIQKQKIWFWWQGKQWIIANWGQHCKRSIKKCEYSIPPKEMTYLKIIWFGSQFWSLSKSCNNKTIFSSVFLKKYHHLHLNEYFECANKLPSWFRQEQSF